MTYEGMDVDVVRGVSQHLRLRADEITGVRIAVAALLGSLEVSWLGPAFLILHDQWNAIVATHLAATAAGLHEAADRLDVAVVEQVTASSASGGAGSVRSPWGPTSVAGSLHRIDEMTDDEKGFVVQVVDDGRGHRRYLVLLSGVNDHSYLGVVGPDGHNIVDAGLEQVGRDPGIERNIEHELAALGVPPGSDIALVGHSQGGIAAMNLALDPAFRERYHLTDVVTAGSPVHAQYSAVSRNDTCNYVRIEDQLDVVPHASDRLVDVPGWIHRYGHQDGARLVVTGVGVNDRSVGALNPWGFKSAHDPDNYATIAQDDGIGSSFDRYLSGFDDRYAGTRRDLFVESEK